MDHAKMLHAVSTRRFDQKEQGYSLVEVLVVVVILVILAAVVIPFMSGQRNKTSDSLAVSHTGSVSQFISSGMSTDGPIDTVNNKISTPLGYIPLDGSLAFVDFPSKNFCLSTVSSTGKIFVATMTRQTPYSAIIGCSSPFDNPTSGVPIGGGNGGGGGSVSGDTGGGTNAAGFGYNLYGQLGDGTTNSSLAPVAVNGSGALAGKTISKIAANSFSHTCAVADGKAYCWGWNDKGQLGDNSNTDSTVAVAVDTSGVLAGKTVSEISVGRYFSCALSEGKVYCWGDNTLGQLGNGSTVDSNIPVAASNSGVLAGKTVTAISLGDYTACALAEGQVYCWGSNNYGALGDNSATNSSVPVAVYANGVLSGKTVSSLASGGSHTCVTSEGKPYCWGANGKGSLGNNTQTNSNVPVAVDSTGVLAGKTVTQLSAGSQHTCAVANGKPYCWGFGSYRQLGNNANDNALTPVAVDISGVLAGKTVSKISLGDIHSCVVADGQAYCWGQNFQGQLGNNSNTDSNTPVAVDVSGILAGKPITEIAGGRRSTIVVTS